MESARWKMDEKNRWKLRILPRKYKNLKEQVWTVAYNN